MLKRLGSPEEELMHEVYLEKLLTILATLTHHEDRQQRSNGKVQFDTDNMLFVADLCSNTGLKSVLDFIQHAPA
jgi:hypothetical protein